MDFKKTLAFAGIFYFTSVGLAHYPEFGQASNPSALMMTGAYTGLVGTLEIGLG